MLSTNRSLFKGEAPRLSADFVYPLSRERPFKFPRHLVRALEKRNNCHVGKYIRSAVFNLHVNGNGHINGNWHGNGHKNGHETDMETDMETEMDTDMELEYFC